MTAFFSQSAYIDKAGVRNWDASAAIVSEAARPGLVADRSEILNRHGDAALLAEIDENLCRAELSAAERALHLAARKRLYEALHPQTKMAVIADRVIQLAKMAT